MLIWVRSTAKCSGAPCGGTPCPHLAASPAGAQIFPASGARPGDPQSLAAATSGGRPGAPGGPQRGPRGGKFGTRGGPQIIHPG